MGGLWSRPVGWTFRELAAAFVSPERGLLVSSIWVAPALIVLVWQWRRIPGWTRAAAIAGVFVLVIQIRVAGHAGGIQLASYRVSLESLALATPALIAAAENLIKHRLAVVTATLAVAVSIGVHAVAAVNGGFEVDTTARWEEIDTNVREQFG